MIKLACKLKQEKKNNIYQNHLKHKNIALIFEKGSTRTRSAIEIAAHNEGADTVYFPPEDKHFQSESIKDAARVLGKMFDGIAFRGFGQDTVQKLAQYSGIPVWNALTDDEHPSQALVDFMTAQEVLSKPYKEIKFAFVGNGQDNIANSLMLAAAKVGMDYTLISPKELTPHTKILNQAHQLAAQSGANIVITDNIEQGIQGADVVTTDVWLSMGESEDIWSSRIKLLHPYQVTMDLLNKTGNPNTVFTHCLPAFHNLDTEVAQKIYRNFGLSEMEVTDEVFESDRSIVFNGVENRIYILQAIMDLTIGN
ncbi:ornithine carbamoyltransferase [Lactobacillus colini]|uniref:Ornithine carbamoyltransferase n=1 Tax=Lactobacillus colini TaxID=1819254 RepID=A0ABS4MC06_9LACO|nr:ornithine carbamoyltransferase [Lactobacillus colini]